MADVILGERLHKFLFMIILNYDIISDVINFKAYIITFL